MRKIKTSNWKHTTKKRHPYDFSDDNIYVGNAEDGIILPRKCAKRFDKHNTPFMQDDLDEDLMQEEYETC